MANKYISPSAELAATLQEELLTEKHASESYDAPSARSKYEALQFKDPVELLYFFHPALSANVMKLYPWQEEVLRFLADASWTKELPLEFNLIACNGSGKDSFILAGIAVFLLTCKIRSRVIISTKSFKQLQFQTYPSIVTICAAINRKMQEIGICEANEDFVTVYSGHLRCEKTGSEIVLFVTDEPGRAEGWHPFPDAPKSIMAILLNEAKSVDRPMFAAFKRCTGYAIWLNISSTGPAQGHFYDRVQDSIHYPEPYQRNRSYCRKITAYDCPSHYTQEFLDKERREMDPDLFGSVYMSEFISLGDSVVIPIHIITKAKNLKICKDADTTEEGGLDLSLGGDYTVFYLRRGPNVLAKHEWRIKDTNVLEAEIGEVLNYCANFRIHVDIGGLGKPIFDHLKKNHEKVQFIGVNNGGTPIKGGKFYATTITEDYFHVKMLLMREHIPAPSCIRTLEQLQRRQYLIAESGRNAGKFTLVPKEQLRAEGEQSPDHADAFVYAYRRYKFHTYVDSLVEAKKVAKTNHEELLDNWQEFASNKLAQLTRNTPKRINTVYDAFKHYAR